MAPSERSFDPQVHLTPADVRVDSREDPQRLEIRIKASKTDPFRKGVTIHLGRTQTDLCPVAAILSYLGIRGPGSGPLFIFQDCRYLMRANFVAGVHQALEAGGIQASMCAGHSFRIGATTTAAFLGVSDSLIKTLGRWESSAYIHCMSTLRHSNC